MCNYKNSVFDVYRIILTTILQQIIFGLKLRQNGNGGPTQGIKN